MESAFRWCLGLCCLSMLQVGCVRIQLAGESGHTGWLHHDARQHAVVAGAGCECSSCDAGPSGCRDGCDDGCGIPGLQPLFDTNWCGLIKQSFCHCGNKLACQGACGEVYWDEHINEPPVCDPCGAQGTFVGGGCVSCKPWYGRWRDLWGYRYDAPGCTSCASSGVGIGHGHGVYGQPARGHASAGCTSCNHGGEAVVHEGSWGDSQSVYSESIGSGATPSTTAPHTNAPSPTPAKPKVVPTPDPSASHRGTQRGAAVAKSSVGTRSKTPARLTSTQKVPASKPMTNVEEDAPIPRQLTVETVNGQKRLVPRHR